MALGIKPIRLPTELLYLIIDALPSSDKLLFRLTCKRFNAYVTPILFETLRIEPHSDFADEMFCEFIRATANLPSESTIASYVRSLQLVSPSPTRHISAYSSKKRLKKFKTSQEGERVIAALFAPKEETINLGEKIAKYLVPFVERMINVDSVTLVHPPDDSNLFSALAKLPNLKQLDLTICPQPIRLDKLHFSKFKGLHSLKVHFDYIYSLEILSFLKWKVMPAIAAMPRLETFSLNTHYRDRDAIHLDSLMQEFNIWQTNSESTFSTTYLRDLRLYGIPVQLSTFHVRRLFQNLKHLTLCHGGSKPIKLLTTEIAWEEIWEALTEGGSKEGLWLETLHTEGSQPPNGLSALFEYLLAHPGLKGLSILTPPFTNKEGGFYFESALELAEKNDLNFQFATLFWTKVVPHSAHSLKELTVNPICEGPWSYGPDASNALRKCIALTKLTMSVSKVPLEWAAEKAADLKMRDSDQFSHLDQEGSGWKSIQWGSIQSTPVLLASDLGKMTNLEEVNVKLAKPLMLVSDPSYPWGVLPEMAGPTLQWLAERMLERFVPWEGYPHDLVGNNRIINFLNYC